MVRFDKYNLGIDFIKSKKTTKVVKKDYKINDDYDINISAIAVEVKK